jgi:hypothetical protein
MKKKIIVPLTAVVLLFFLLLSIKEAFWFESMIVDRMLFMKYPHEKTGIVDRLNEYKQLFVKGEEAAKQLEWAKGVWNVPDSSPEDYEAAMIIVTDLGLNKSEWLSLGNIVKYLGIPSNIEGLFPITDDEGNLLVIPEKFDVFYEDKKIRFNFSLSGFLESIMLVTLNGSYESGASDMYWPQPRYYKYAKDFPIYAGYKYDQKINEFILKNTRERIIDAIGKGAFFGNIENLSQQERDLIDIKNMRIYMVDGISRHLGRAYYDFTTKDMNVSYSTWFFTSGEQLTGDSILNINEIVKEKFKKL